MTEKKERSEAQKNQLLMAQKKAYEKRKNLAEAKQTPEPTEPEPEPERKPTPPPSPEREPTPPPSPKREPSPPPPPPEPVVETQPSLRYERGTLMFYE